MKKIYDYYTGEELEEHPMTWAEIYDYMRDSFLDYGKRALVCSGKRKRVYFWFTHGSGIYLSFTDAP